MFEAVNSLEWLLFWFQDCRVPFYFRVLFGDLQNCFTLLPMELPVLVFLLGTKLLDLQLFELEGAHIGGLVLLHRDPGWAVWVHHKLIHCFHTFALVSCLSVCQGLEVT